MKSVAKNLLVVLCTLLVVTLASGGDDARGADVEALRQYSLYLVNQARSDEGLAPLTMDDTLVRSAEFHARDMLARGYFAHVTPDGRDVMDRYLAAGGGQWRLVAENIGRCSGCRTPITRSDIERQHEGWMHSPEHRANILRRGLDRYGLGIAAADGEFYAVQNFSGPGTPLGAKDHEGRTPPPKALSPEALDAMAVELVNQRRDRVGAPPVAADEVLSEAARRLLPDDVTAFELNSLANVSLSDAVPPSSRGPWRRLVAVSGSCGGCGTEPTDADVRYFIAQWLDDPQYGDRLLSPRLRRLGFALRSDRQGRKIAVAIIGAL